MVEVRLFIFASLRETFSEETTTDIKLGERQWASCEELKVYLLDLLLERCHRRYGPEHKIKLPATKSFMLAINECFVDPSEPVSLEPNDHIAMIPPVSGG